MKQKHTKYTQINTNKSMHSEMSPVWQNPIQRTVRTAHLSALMTVHSFSTQYSTEHQILIISYLQTNFITQMLMKVIGSRSRSQAWNVIRPPLGLSESMTKLQWCQVHFIYSGYDATCHYLDATYLPAK